MLKFDIAGAQIEGARDYQEDAFLITHLGDRNETAGSLIIVADGMGGHAAGNVASNMAVQTFNTYVSANFPCDNIAEVLERAMLEANGAITETVRETAALRGMGCTLVAVVLYEDHLHWVSVGDSHLYLLRGGELIKKNADHSYGGFLDRMAAEGNPMEAEPGYSRNMLMSALTGEEIAEIDCPTRGFEVEDNDLIILASDGLDSLSREHVIGLLSPETPARADVDSLLSAVEDAGLPKQDNTTVVVIRAKAPNLAKFGADRPMGLEPTGDASAPAADAPTFTIEEPERRRRSKTAGAHRSPLPMVVGLTIAAAAVALGAWWYMIQSQPEFVPPQAEVPIEELLPEAPEPVTVVPALTFRDSAAGLTGPLMADLPAGTFAMGSPNSSVHFDERPRHDVSVPAFAIGVTEVTVGEYRVFANATGRPLLTGGAASGAPVTGVSYDDAAAYARWLGQRLGQPYRLPTEAEWEYAARAGSSGSWYWGTSPEPGLAHCVGCESGRPPLAPIDAGSLPPNAFGLYDMAGNVQEWVEDCYRENYEGHPADGSAVLDAACTTGVARGGSFSSSPKALRSASRAALPRGERNDYTGFRVARDRQASPAAPDEG